MRVAVCAPQVPFVRGGAELMADDLVAALRRRGHEAELVTIPFKWYPGARVLDQAFLWRLVDLTESDGRPIDRVIATKFPAYCVRHPNKVAWVLHQFRQAYDYDRTELGQFSESPEDRATRRAIELLLVGLLHVLGLLLLPSLAVAALLPPAHLRRLLLDAVALVERLLPVLVLALTRFVAGGLVLAPASGVLAPGTGPFVQLEHSGDGAVEERAVMGDDDDSCARPCHEALQPVEPLEVEVVGRLVEQEDVEAREQDRRESRARSLSSGERPHGQLEPFSREAGVRAGDSGARIQISAAEHEQALERLGMGRDQRRIVSQAGRESVEPRLGFRHAGPPREVAE